MEVLSKKQLHRGVLTLLKTWLKPLPDGSLPNINICGAILRILTDFPIDLEHYDRREQLKKSGLGKVDSDWLVFSWAMLAVALCKEVATVESSKKEAASSYKTWRGGSWHGQIPCSSLHGLSYA
ncbi:hypothetical protein ACSBR1_013283 [Camellia fascicularis]